jgi:putative ATP-dependent endonuclease of OLD family
VDLANEIENYPKLVEEARKHLGLNDEGKPLVARYIARKLTSKLTPAIPKTVRAIIEKAIAVQRKGTCLKTQAPD